MYSGKNIESGYDAATLGALVQSDRVHTSLYTSGDIFATEIEKIFNQTWVWVGHESEVPDAGSFKSSMVGTQPVIVVRDRKGNINVLLNRCRHRAATVCEHRAAKPTALSARITAGVTVSTVPCAAYRIRKAMAIPRRKSSSAWCAYAAKATRG